jgi:SnoaL-like domain
MGRLAQAASVRPTDSNFARLAYAERLAGFFTTNAVLHLEGLGRDFPVIASKSDLREAAMAARAQLRQAEFKVTDVNVTFPGEKGTARAYVVITGRINAETNDFGQAFRMTVRKTHGQWLISEVNTVQRLE